MYRDQPSTQSTPSAGQGYLVIHVTTARGSIPLEGAQITIRNHLPQENEAAGDAIATLVSGTDGNTARIPLEAPPRASSMRPGNGKPYASYVAEVRLEGYYDQLYSGIPIFDGITAIQPADLIPLPENGQSDSCTPDSTRAFESEAPTL
ncbi:MAG: hypothetical protein IJW16_03865 [Clostridia bacterium]|nr:hypothetical protein [Clostridia bacterium]